MELRQIFKIIFKNYKLVLLVAALAALVTALIYWQLPDKYQVSLPLLITKTGTGPSEPEAEYQYSGYYALKAADEFGKTVEQWFGDAEVACLILDKAKGILAKDDVKAMSNFFRAQQIDPQQVEVRFVLGASKAVQDIILAIPEVIQQKADEVDALSSGLVSFSITGTKAAVILKKYEILPSALIAFCLGLIFGVFIVFVKRYFKD